MLKVVFAKIGMIGITTMIEGLFDERAVRTDIVVRSVYSGCKMEPFDAKEVVEAALAFKPNLIIFVSPYLQGEGPLEAVDLLSKCGVPTCVITNTASKAVLDKLEMNSIGYIVVDADPMIGAKKEFLDPVEMCLFNSDIIRVLALTGVYRAIQVEVDKIINSIKKGVKPYLPTLILDKEKALNYANYQNPYAAAKAMAAFEAARLVAELSTRGCYAVKDAVKALHYVSASHEVMRLASLLADEAREIEKGKDRVERLIHLADGTVIRRLKLLDGL
ncbi:MAG: F420-dependent methylenetetrahydromethanopterin dehydrogenase [Nitrososphaerales archaeon]